MRLLQLSEGGELSLTSHDTDHVPPYAILSHTWGPTAEELTLQDIERHSYREKTGFAKVRFCGEQAKKDGYDYFWVDSCCIDKTSSAELSRSIISMFRWYKRAATCYVYLQDVSTSGLDGPGESRELWETSFRKSRWFTRGWTLQELLAPQTVQFFSRDGELLGDKVDLLAVIVDITGIPPLALQGAPLSDFPPNERLRWATTRQTKEKEDKAYCLAGIFDLVLQPMYGEEEYAFHRLQEAIAKRWSQLEPGLIALCMDGTQNTRRPVAPTAMSPQHRTRLVSSLSFDRMNAHRANIRLAQRATCEWLLEHPTYLSWQGGLKVPQGRSILWINGKPGAGKSTLMKFAFAHAKKQRETRKDIVISFFFNARGEAPEKTTVGMYRALLYQLLEAAPDLQRLLDEIKTDTAAENLSSLWTLEMIRELFAEAVAALGNRRLTCFIDALDECNEGQIWDMVTLFERLADSAMDGGSRLHICFASRHYPAIRVRKSLSMILEHENGHAQDLEEYIQQHLDIDADDQVRNDRIRSELHRKSNGVFIWVVLVVEILNITYRSGRIWAVERRLQEIPEKLSDLFRDLLRRDCKDTDELLFCLQWILFAKRRLWLEEFYSIMRTTLGPDPPGCPNPQTVSKSAMARLVTSLSKGLAESTIYGAVQFIHESVRDFLLKDGGLCELWPHLNGRVESICHEQLKQCCQQHLRSVDIKRITTSSAQHAPPASMLTLRSLSNLQDLRVVKQSCPFLEYASQNILYHANRAAGHISQTSFLDQFPFDSWVLANDVFHLDPEDRHHRSITLLHVLAEGGFHALIASYPRNGSRSIIEDGAYGYLLMEAFAHAQRPLLRSLLNGNGSVSLEDLARDPGFGLQFKAREDTWQWAVATRNWSLAKCFRASGTQIHVPCTQTPASYSQTLGRAAFQTDDRIVNGRNALSLAAKNGNETGIERLVKAGADVNGCTEDMDPPLHCALKRCRWSAVQMLLDLGADVNSQGRYSGSPLHATVSYSRMECGPMVSLLLEYGADVNAEGGKYGNALQAACFKQSGSVVKLLLEAGADVNAEGGYYGNALQAACFKRSDSTVELLLEAGADVNAEGGYFGTALQAASQRDTNKKKVRMLLDAGADVNTQGGQFGSAFEAAYANNAQKIIPMLVDAGANMQGGRGYFGTALQAASVILDNHKSIKLLLGAGADVNEKGGFYGSALQAASSRHGNKKAVRTLLEAGANVNAQGGFYRSALHAACVEGDEVIAEMLIEAGADVNAQGVDYGGVLQTASVRGNHEIVRMLLDAGADVNAHGGYYGTALQGASTQGNIKVVQMLIVAGADVNAKGGEFGSALNAANMEGTVRIAQILRDAGATE